MKNVPIEGGTEGVGASQGWHGLSVLYNTVKGANANDVEQEWPNMVTHWQLSKEEIAGLVLGGKLELSILGNPGSWPPMMLGVKVETGIVGTPPNEDAQFLEDLAKELEDWDKSVPDRLRKIAETLS